MLIRQLFTAALLAATTAAATSAQSVADEIAQGDKENAAFNPQAALQHYETALKTDKKNAELLDKAARAALDLGTSADSTRDAVGEYTDTTRIQLFQKAADYAQRAVELDSLNSDVRAVLSQASLALSLGQGIMQRIRPMFDAHLHAATCLKFNPRAADCVHALGTWYTEVMLIDTVEPGMHRGLMIGSNPQIPGAMENLQDVIHASWDMAERYLLRAVSIQPDRAAHHYALGRVYRYMKEPAKAKAQFEAVLKAPDTEYNDKNYKKSAQLALQQLASASGG